jgi:branched-chain amino acid transport system permease protein
MIQNKAIETAAPRRGLRPIDYVPLVVFAILLISIPFTTSYLQYLVAKILIYSIFALSLNLLFGWGGMFPLGHAAFFGAGGYIAGIMIVRAGITSFWLLVPAAAIAGAITGAAFAVIALRSKGLLFSIITMALCTVLVTLATRSTDITGGDNGLVGITYPVLFPGLELNLTTFYVLVLVLTLLVWFLNYRIIKSPFGLALQGIRDDEGRMAHLGYNTWLFKFSAFALAGGIAGFGGMLFASCNNVMVPQHLGVITSVTAVLMVIMGGNRSVFGPVVGAVVVTGLETIFTIYLSDRWPLILGCIFVITVMFLRGGLTPYILKLWGKVTKRDGSD